MLFAPSTSTLFRRASCFAALSVALLLPAVAADPAPTDSQSRFEVDFLTDLIDHHHAAVEMAGLVAERSEREELREFATDLAEAQTEEIAIVQGWLEEWYGETHEPELDRKSERLLETLEELEGDAFEQAFLRAMSLHHGEALVMASDGLLEGWHTELIDFLREMVATQADEIALMRGWLLEWHEINEVTPRDRPDNRRWNLSNSSNSANGPRPILPRPSGP
jgi:uncharacterized protein (DUF305 family)